MSAQLWREVRRQLDQHEYMTGVGRTVERIRATGEVFTPSALVVEMVSRLPLERFRPGRTVLDPACGDGQFLVAAKWIKVLAFEVDEEQAVSDLYGIDIMRDNVDVCRRRLGGGTIVMGDALNPSSRLDDQTDEEHDMMLRLFTSSNQLALAAA